MYLGLFKNPPLQVATMRFKIRNHLLVPESAFDFRVSIIPYLKNHKSNFNKETYLDIASDVTYKHAEF
jgi:hypothetical protein